MHTIEISSIGHGAHRSTFGCVVEYGVGGGGGHLVVVSAVGALRRAADGGATQEAVARQEGDGGFASTQGELELARKQEREITQITEARRVGEGRVDVSSRLSLCLFTEVRTRSGGRQPIISTG
jgi:hypothetical protein